MSMSYTAWSLDKKKPLQPSSLKVEDELQQLLPENIDILNKNWLVIGKQVYTTAGKFIDILCIDRDGDIVVVELKRDLTPREVTAQVIDYAASVSKLKIDEIAKLYLEFTNGTETLNDAFLNKYGTALDEESVNQNVKMVIVAAKMDDGTERIIHFLRDTYNVDINILFFSVFQSEKERILCRMWLDEDIEESLQTKNSERGTWNGEYYASFGEGERKWEDAMKYGFISAGGGTWYSQTLSMLSPGDRVWVNIPHTGYVGVGIVTESATLAMNAVFDVDGKTVKMPDLKLHGNYFYSEDDPENAEYIVNVRWHKTVPVSEAIKEAGFFGNQNTVCRPSAKKWTYTIERLKKCWEIE